MGATTTEHMTILKAMPSGDSVAPEPEDGSDIGSARRVLSVEGHGLAALAASLGTEFVEALDVLCQVSGRVVVTGIGKSGHVGRKIAATFASTGTPAMFVHPAEASHGDLGMITPGDAILALSNSGETSELAHVVVYAKRFEIPLIAVTKKGDSALAKAATVTLVVPDSDEACPMRLAPTTSTTVMMALGDALAVTLFERKGFTANDFQTFHPGGELGRRLVPVADIMHVGSEVPLIDGDAPMAQALVTMTAKRFGCVGIVATDGHLRGIITDGDLRRHMGPDLVGVRAADVMNPDPKTIRPGALASEALGVMNARTITNLFVVDDAQVPVGIVHIHDCLRAGQDRLS